MRSRIARIGGATPAGSARRSENWDWPPGRCRNITVQRATVRAISGPWSSSTRARARSMPAVIPAEVAIDADVGMAAGQLLAERPVRGRRPALEQAGLGEQKGTGADRAGAARAGGYPPQRRRQPRVAEDVINPQAAADDHRVDAAAAHVAERDVGAEAQPARAANGLAIGSRDDHPVATVPTEQAGGGVEHVGGADDVEQLHSLEGDEDDLALWGRHRDILPARAAVRKDLYPSDSDKR